MSSRESSRSANWLDELATRVLRRRISHLRPRYLLDLTRLVVFERMYPEAPWLTPSAVSVLSSALRSSDQGLEYGSGRSTSWFARRTARLVSVETDQHWHWLVQAQLSKSGLSERVDYRLIRADERRTSDPLRAAYLAIAEELPPESLDYVVIDGIYRGECAVRAPRLLRSGGLLIVDNINRYLPSQSRSPLSTHRIDGPDWSKFLALVGPWRLIWTTSGVTDTAIWIRTQ